MEISVSAVAKALGSGGVAATVTGGSIMVGNELINGSGDVGVEIETPDTVEDKPNVSEEKAKAPVVSVEVVEEGRKEPEPKQLTLREQIKELMGKYTCQIKIKHEEKEKTIDEFQDDSGLEGLKGFLEEDMKKEENATEKICPKTRNSRSGDNTPSSTLLVKKDNNWEQTDE